MIVLALDTSTSQGGVALVDDTLTVRARAVWQRVKSHSEFLTPTIEGVLREAQLTLKDVDALAVGHGPGSFTGIRIAVSAVKGLAYALQKPVYAFDTLEILAHGVSDHSRPVLSLVNAHKNLLFANVYDWRAYPLDDWRAQALADWQPSAADDWEARSGRWVPRHKIEALSLEAIARLVQEPILCVGDGYLEYEDHFRLELRKSLIRDAAFADEPSPETLGRMALTLGNHNQALEWNSLQALYIRASGAEESLETKQR